jgi:hypothetical protein
VAREFRVSLTVVQELLSGQCAFKGGKDVLRCNAMSCV